MGLLDALNTDEARLGLGLLAAGGYSPTPMSVGQRVQMAMQGMDAQKQNQLKTKLVQSQIDENSSQADMRKQQLLMSQRQMDMQNRLLGFGQPQGAGYMPAQPYGVQNLPQAGTSDAPGQLGAATPGAQPTPLGGGQQGGTLEALSKQYGIPPEALQYDLVFNGGKGIAEMVSKRGTPDMQVSNGYAYDKNRLGAGYLPQLNVSQDGKTSMVRIGPDGLPIVSAPQGAMETFGGYQRAQAGYKPIKVYNPATGREEYSNEAAVSQPSGEAGMRTAVQGGMGADPMAIQREIKATQNDLMKPLDATSRAALQSHLADLQAQAQRTPVPSGNVAAGPSAAEAAVQKANEAKAVDTAKADVVRDTSKTADSKRYGQLTAGVSRAIELLKAGPTASGAGSLYDAAQGFFGESNKGADIASQLDTLSGWLTANVPRMEGPQSDKDVANYRIQAAAVGDRTKPVSQRLKAAEELQSLQNKYAALNGMTPTGAPGAPDKPAAPVATMRYNPKTGKLEKVQ